jgi:hypothetical protein
MPEPDTEQDQQTGGPPEPTPPEPQKQRRLQGLREFLRTTRGMVAATVGFVLFLWSLYQAVSAAHDVYVKTSPELRAIASPADFRSLLFSVANPSSMFSLRIISYYCVLGRVVTSNPNDLNSKYVIIGHPTALFITIHPNDPPINIKCPFTFLHIPTSETIKPVIATAIVIHNVEFLGIPLRENRVAKDFYWKSDKWIEGTIFG